MSQWSQVQQLEIKFLEQVDQFYDDNFPMEIRHLLAQWIESQDWEAAANNEAMAMILLQNLIIQVDEQLERVSQEKNLLLIHNLKRVRKLLQGKYHGNPMHIAVIISNCLREERRILAAASMPVQGPLEKSLQSSVVSERQRNVEHKVSAIKNSAQVPFCPVCCLCPRDFHTDTPELSLSWVAEQLLPTDPPSIFHYSKDICPD